MVCQNCGKNEVNFRYTQIINGEKREIALCDKCAKKLGLESLDFSREIEELFDMSFAESFLPSFARTNMLRSKNLRTIFNNQFFEEVSQNPEQIETKSSLSDSERQDVLKDIENAIRKNKQENKKQKLESELEKAIKEERYEDAAKIRDEIKKLD